MYLRCGEIFNNNFNRDFQISLTANNFQNQSASAIVIQRKESSEHLLMTHSGQQPVFCITLYYVQWAFISMDSTRQTGLKSVEHTQSWREKNYRTICSAGHVQSCNNISTDATDNNQRSIYHSMLSWVSSDYSRVHCLDIRPATQANSAWPSLQRHALWLPMTVMNRHSKQRRVCINVLQVMHNAAIMIWSSSSEHTQLCED